jgi:hypothetical protein
MSCAGNADFGTACAFVYAAEFTQRPVFTGPGVIEIGEGGECDAVYLCTAGLVCGAGTCYQVDLVTSADCGFASAVCSASEWCQPIQFPQGDSACFPIGALP